MLCVVWIFLLLQNDYVFSFALTRHRQSAAATVNNWSLRSKQESIKRLVVLIVVIINIRSIYTYIYG